MRAGLVAVRCYRAHLSTQVVIIFPIAIWRAALQVGLEVAAYFVTGRAKIGSEPGMMYLVKDCLLVPVQRKNVMVSKRKELSIA